MARPSSRSTPASGTAQAEAGAARRRVRGKEGWRRELAYRRPLLSVARRLARVVSLHLVDAALLAATVFVAAGLWGVPELRELTATVVIVLLVGLNAVAAYRPGEGRRSYRRLLRGMGLGALILTAITLFPPYLDVPLTVMLATVAGGFVAVAAGRTVADQVVRQAYKRGLGLRRAVVIGTLDEVGQAIEQLRDERNIDQYIVGHLAPDDEPDPTALGALSGLAEALETHDIQEVVLATSLAQGPLREVCDACFERGTLLYVFPAVLERVDCRVEPLHVGPCPLLHLTPGLQVRGILVKRVFDVVAASLALIVTLPLIAVVAAAIRLDSPGPAFFRQERVGLGGRTFTMWKFRSMYLGSEAEREGLDSLNAYGDPRLFKVEDDPRITRVGRALRRTSLDELPQLINVLLGDMSLVGPRPPLPSEVESYEPHHFERLSVVPGITGPWQVGGRNLITDFEKVVRMERAYIRSWSLTLDLKILVRTVKVVITGEGAY